MSENSVTAEALRQLSQQRAAAENPAAISRLHTDDVIFDNITDDYTFGDITTQPVIGKSEVQAHLEATYEDGEVLTLGIRHAVALGKWGYTSGTWRVDKAGGGVNRGNYLHVIKPVDGELKIVREIFDVTELDGFEPKQT